jgi:DNA-binding CsgD family transcriptional regulator
VAVEDLRIEQHPSQTVVEDARPLATLRLAPEELTDRAGLDWFESQDDLDHFRAATLSLGGGAPVFLLRAYRHDPEFGMLLLGSPAVSSSEVDALLHALRVQPPEVLDRVDADTVATKSLDRSNETGDLERRVAELEHSVRLVSSALQRTALREFTPRQREVLSALLSGSTGAEIAAELGISEDTVRSHLRAVRNRIAHGDR